MKDWKTIGTFAKAAGLTPKALRVYERLGILMSFTRGTNSYRYYRTDQLSLALRIKELKNLGFSLKEVKSLLSVDGLVDAQTIVKSMQHRLKLIKESAIELAQQEKQIELILSSLNKKSGHLRSEQRRVVMNLYRKVLIVVTGYTGLEQIAKNIQMHFEKLNEDIEVFQWDDAIQIPQVRPCILIIKESQLKDLKIKKLNPDIVIISGVERFSIDTKQSYLNLYQNVGPHVSTVINADDRAAVEIAGEFEIKKGRIHYFSKNQGLKPQISKIGGLVSNGEEVELFGFNLEPEIIHFKFKSILAFHDETALLASIGAMMNIGADPGLLAF